MSLALERAKDLFRVGYAVRFTDLFCVYENHRVAPDDNAVWIVPGDRCGFSESKVQYLVFDGAIGRRKFIESWSNHLEGQAEKFQYLATAGGGGGKDESHRERSRARPSTLLRAMNLWFDLLTTMSVSNGRMVARVRARETWGPLVQTLKQRTLHNSVGARPPRSRCLFEPFEIAVPPPRGNFCNTRPDVFASPQNLGFPAVSQNGCCAPGSP